MEHEKKRWETGKFALQNTRALIDTKVIEKGLIGGQLLPLLNTTWTCFFSACTDSIFCNQHGFLLVWNGIALARRLFM